MWVKKLAPDPIYVDSLEDFYEVKKVYKQSQIVSYTCKQCKTIVTRSIWKVTNLHNTQVFDWLCTTCHREQYCLQVYGCKSPRQSPVVQEKARNTNMKKYGYAIPNCTTERKRNCANEV